MNSTNPIFGNPFVDEDDDFILIDGIPIPAKFVNQTAEVIGGALQAHPSKSKYNNRWV